MTTPIWNANVESIGEAATILRRGGLVAFPTETVYGLGANALDAVAVGKIFVAKGRPNTNPVIVHVGDVEAAARLTTDWTGVADRLAAAFWPGPLTLVLPRAACVPGVVTAGGPTVALRCPDHAVARALLTAADVPLAAPSANRSTELSPTRAEHVFASLNGRIDAILDGGPCRGGIESTVVDVTNDRVRLLRPGLISQAMLEAVVGPLAAATEHAIARSPGLMDKHYSPRTPLRLATREDAERLRDAGALVLDLGDDPAKAAAELYAKLHELDAQGGHLIVVIAPPASADWLAIRDRLTRAARLG